MSQMEQSITQVAKDKSGLTLADLTQFVHACNNAVPPVDPRHTVSVQVGWRGQALKIAVGPKRP